MSVLIKGMDMPQSCDECPCCHDNGSIFFSCEYFCAAIDNAPDIPNIHNYRLENCPLREIPTPHGRLIDADKLEKALVKRWNVEDDQDFCNKAVWQELDNAPTVIEAEG